MNLKNIPNETTILAEHYAVIDSIEVKEYIQRPFEDTPKDFKERDKALLLVYRYILAQVIISNIPDKEE